MNKVKDLKDRSKSTLTEKAEETRSEMQDTAQSIKAEAEDAGEKAGQANR